MVYGISIRDFCVSVERKGAKRKGAMTPAAE